VSSNFGSKLGTNGEARTIWQRESASTGQVTAVINPQYPQRYSEATEGTHMSFVGEASECKAMEHQLQKRSSDKPL
jgi:hypothetical protein